MDKKKSTFPVGYAKPPRHTRFKPGQSGNPSGRPKKKPGTLAEAFEKELQTYITVREGGKKRRITILGAIAKQHVNKAATGDPKSMALLMKALEPRELVPGDNLSPVLEGLRAIHAKHEMADKKKVPMLLDSAAGLPEDPTENGNEGNDGSS